MPHYPKAEWKNLVLQASIHPRFQFILWLAAQRRLATVERLQKFGIQVPTDFAFCAQAPETFNHLFFECRITLHLWTRLYSWLGFH